MVEARKATWSIVERRAIDVLLVGPCWSCERPNKIAELQAARAYNAERIEYRCRTLERLTRESVLFRSPAALNNSCRPNCAHFQPISPLQFFTDRGKVAPRSVTLRKIKLYPTPWCTYKTIRRLPPSWFKPPRRLYFPLVLPERTVASLSAA